MTDQTEALERIWAVSGSRKHWQDEPPASGLRTGQWVEYIRADLSDANIAEAEQRGYASAMDAERKDADARIAALEAERDEQVQWVKDLADDVAHLEAKLAKALDALTDVQNDCKLRAVNGVVPIGSSCWEKLCATLTELQGPTQ